MDAYGDHAVRCTQNNVWQRHYLVQDYLLRQFRSAGIQCLREQSLLHTERREADLLIPNWAGTRAMAIDLTIRHHRTLGLAFLDPHSILQAAEAEKRRHAQQRANAADCHFEPLVMHTWSGLSGQGTSRAFLNQLLNKIADNRPGANKQAKLSEMTQALSCIVAAQVAEQITAAVGPWEIPVMPAWEVPLRTDEHGNSLPGVKRSPKDSYSELNRRTRPRRDSSPPRAHPQTRTDLNTAPELGSQTTPPEYSPSFTIPSGPGGLQSAEPSWMDVLARFQSSARPRAKEFQL